MLVTIYCQALDGQTLTTSPRANIGVTIYILTVKVVADIPRDVQYISFTVQIIGLGDKCCDIIINRYIQLV